MGTASDDSWEPPKRLDGTMGVDHHFIRALSIKNMDDIVYTNISSLDYVSDKGWLVIAFFQVLLYTLRTAVSRTIFQKLEEVFKQLGVSVVFGNESKQVSFLLRA